ncbi:MAG: TIGR03905 family TSCPD domain-containing protein [Lentisphaeria bacterium]|nr:TIGR03905 family TSCPD domain-containing protein [Lentisphaeria bacterium]
MKKYHYPTSGEVCSQSIDIEIAADGKIAKVHFNGGCPGSLSAVSLLVSGKTPDEAVKLLSGVTCGSKNTSCPDQLAQALKKLIF